MAKIALLATLTIRTRVIVDMPEGYDKKDFLESDDCIQSAFERVESNILSFPRGYLTQENLDIEEETEAPYGSLDEDIAGDEKRKSLPESTNDVFVDLGLPSGTLWAKRNEQGYFKPEEARNKFGDSLPSMEDIQELREYCTWQWDNARKAAVVTGISGNSIVLFAAGYANGKNKVRRYGEMGKYISSTKNRFMPKSLSYFLEFTDMKLLNGFFNNDCHAYSVRLVKKQ